MLREETDTVEVPREAEFCTAQLLVSAYWSLQLPQMTGRSGQCSYDPNVPHSEQTAWAGGSCRGRTAGMGRECWASPKITSVTADIY